MGDISCGSAWKKTGQQDCLHMIYLHKTVNKTFLAGHKSSEVTLLLCVWWTDKEKSTNTDAYY